MDNLTAALAAVGGVVLAAVVAHGAWTSRRAAPKQAGAPAEPDGERREPVLGDLGEVLAGADSTAASRRAGPRIDALIDAIVPLKLEAPVSGDMAIAHLPATRRAGSKPFHIEGLNRDTREWEAPLPGAHYDEFQAGAQMANRGGALNEIEYSEFVQKVEAFAEALGAMADFPDMLDVVARARELDAFASEHDAQITVHLQARGAAWSVAYLQQVAGRHGFVPGALPGRLVMPAAEEGAPPMLTLAFDAQAALADDANQSSVREALLSLDVAQTDAALEPFAAWHAAATALSQDMDAAIVDDDGQPLTLHAFAAIGKDLEQLYRTLASHDLAAGSPAARRLFS